MKVSVTIQSNHSEMMIMMQSIVKRETTEAPGDLLGPEPLTQDPAETQRYPPPDYLISPDPALLTPVSSNSSRQEKLKLPKLSTEIMEDPVQFEEWHQDCLQQLYLHSQMTSTIAISANDILRLTPTDIPHQTIHLYTSLKAILPTEVTPNILIDPKILPITVLLSYKPLKGCTVEKTWSTLQCR